MKSPRLLLPLSLGLICFTAPAKEQRLEADDSPPSKKPSVLRFIETMRQRLKHDLSRLVVLTGLRGNPIPSAWTMTYYDEASETYLSYIEPGEAPEPADFLYPDGETPNFFQASRIKIDSPDAFAKAESLAVKAKVGFDSVDFELRGREFSSEPIWRLRLKDEYEHIVGIIDLSAESGKTLRTVWVRLAANGEIKVTDSAVVGLAPEEPAKPSSSDSDPAKSGSTQKALPVEKLDPLPLPPEIKPTD